MLATSITETEDQITTTRNEAITPHSERCHDLVDATERKALARTVPTTVIWMSAWEKSDLVVDGKTLVAGTPEGEAEIMSRMDAALARVTAGGARVVLVTVAACRSSSTTTAFAPESSRIHATCSADELS